MHNQLVVKEGHAEPGFCRQYYHVVSINGNPPKTPLLICVQEEMPDQFEWYTTSNDGTWNEPEGPIKRSLTIVDEDGKVLREPLHD